MAYRFKHGDRPLDDYTIQRAVGAGGFGEVYYAISDGGREVALKYLRENPQVELRGVSHCINLKSPYLVSIFDVKKNADGDYFIIMEYCSGPSLRDLLIAEPNGFDSQKAAFFAREIAKGLSYLHDRGIVHRDLKPGNIFYDDGYVKIGDYGLSKFIAVSRHSVQTSSVGTVHYMAPEIGSGNYSRGVDIYALGVILYEMLLGKVPFEGSTMAEVLMKHLTAQPEVDNLPHPFGSAIRKALQKDPKDRYQTVNELIDDLLSVEEVTKSLAGFSPRSLEGAVRRGAAEAVSPVPSPNPSPGYPQDLGKRIGRRQARMDFDPEAVLSERVSKRLERISRKLDKKINKLAGAWGAGSALAPPVVPGAVIGGTRRWAEAAGRRRRIVLSGLLAVGLAVGLGVLVGSAYGEEAGISSAMLVVAMSGGIVLARRAITWFGEQYGPKWSRSIIRLCCCAPLMAIGAAPLMDLSSNTGGAVYLGLLFLAAFVNWDKAIERSSDGEMSFWSAVWMAFCGALATRIAAAIFDLDPGNVVFVGAGVAGVVSLIIQATAWWLPTRTAQGTGRGDAEVGDGEDQHRRAVALAVPVECDACCPDSSPQSAPPTQETPQTADTQGAARAQAASPAGTQATHERWLVTRALWSIIAFVLMGGAIVAFLVPLIAKDTDSHDITASIIACTGCAAFMLFALRKTTLTRRGGFWLDTLRPFLISLSLFGIGGTITGISREWNHYDDPCAIKIRRFEKRFAQFQARAGAVSVLGIGLHEPLEPLEPPLCAEVRNPFRTRPCVGDAGRVALVSGLVMSSLSFLGLTLFTGRRPRAPRPFVVPGSGGDDNADRKDGVGGGAGGGLPADLDPEGTKSEGLKSVDCRSANWRPPAADYPGIPRQAMAGAAAVRAHRGVTVLVLGILGINIFPLGIAAWVMGNNDLQEMDAGRVDSRGRGMTAAGRVCGIIGTIIALFGALTGMAAFCCG